MAKKSNSKASTKKSKKSKTSSPAKAAVKITHKTVTINPARRFYLPAAALLAALSVAAISLMNYSSVPLTLSHQTKDVLLSQGATVLAPASKILFDVPVRFVLALILGISAFHAALLATRMSQRFENDIANQVRPFRWIHLAVTGLLTVELVGLISGVNDIATLKLMGCLVVLSAFLGWAIERYNQNGHKPSRVLFLLSLGAQALSTLPILFTLLGTYTYGLERSGWYVYAAIGLLLVSCVLFYINMWRWLKQSGPSKDYAYIDRNYALIDLGLKVMLAATLIVGLSR